MGWVRGPSLVLAVVGLAACGAPECGIGFRLAEAGGCELDRVAACGDGQVRTIAGECVTPYATTNEPIVTDPPDDTGLGGDTADTDADPVVDTGETDLVDTAPAPR